MYHCYFLINYIGPHKVFFLSFGPLFKKFAHHWARRSEDRIPVGARFSAPVQTGPGAHPPSCIMGTGSFPGVKSGRGLTLITHPFQCRDQESYTSATPMGRTACTEPWCLYNGALTFYFVGMDDIVQYIEGIRSSSRSSH